MNGTKHGLAACYIGLQKPFKAAQHNSTDASKVRLAAAHVKQHIPGRLGGGRGGGGLGPRPLAPTKALMPPRGIPRGMPLPPPWGLGGGPPGPLPGSMPLPPRLPRLPASIPLARPCSHTSVLTHTLCGVMTAKPQLSFLHSVSWMHMLVGMVLMCISGSQTPHGNALSETQLCNGHSIRTSQYQSPTAQHGSNQLHPCPLTGQSYSDYQLSTHTYTKAQALFSVT